MLRITEIGIIKNAIDDEDNPYVIKAEESEIHIKEEFIEGLYRIEENEFIDVVFAFDRSDSYELKATTLRGNYKGVFATRKPDRPSSIGVCTVELIERKGNILIVKGLDALNGTPVLDLKPLDNSMVENQIEDLKLAKLKSTPRFDVVNDLLKNNLSNLLIRAAAMHGHYCPGIALGVMAAAKAMQLMKQHSDGMEDLIAITETNNCFSDGLQYVTGCTFGNNALIFKDFGKTAFTLAKRDGKGIRINTTVDAKAYMREANPLFSQQYEQVVKGQDHSEVAITKFKQLGRDKAFATLELDFDKLFVVEKVSVEIPKYAPSHESIICDSCGELVMMSRIKDNQCLACTESKYGCLTGDGIE